MFNPENIIFLLNIILCFNSSKFVLKINPNLYAYYGMPFIIIWKFIYKLPLLPYPSLSFISMNNKSLAASRCSAAGRKRQKTWSLREVCIFRSWIRRMILDIIQKFIICFISLYNLVSIASHRCNVVAKYPVLENVIFRIYIYIWWRRLCHRYHRRAWIYQHVLLWQ